MERNGFLRNSVSVPIPEEVSNIRASPSLFPYAYRYSLRLLTFPRGGSNTSPPSLASPLAAVIVAAVRTACLTYSGQCSVVRAAAARVAVARAAAQRRSGVSERGKSCTDRTELKRRDRNALDRSTGTERNGIDRNGIRLNPCQELTIMFKDRLRTSPRLTAWPSRSTV